MNANSPDLIIHGGEILTVDPAMSVVEAVAVRDGRIVATGPYEAILPMRHGGTRMVDLEGRALLPGLIEAHGHPLLTGISRGDPTIDIRAIINPSFEAALATIRRRVAKAAPDEFMLFFGLDPQLHQGLHELTIDELDAIAPEHPIAVQTSNFHVIYLNSRALRLFNIDALTPDPPGGHIVRGANGYPTGRLEERATRMVLEPYWRMLGEARGERVFSEWMWHHAHAGYTTSAEIGIMPSQMPYFEALLRGQEAPVRLVGYQWMNPEIASMMPPGSGNDRFRMVGMKLIADGSPFAGNIWVSKPYLNTAMTLKGMGLPRDHTGHMNWTADEIHAMVDGYAAKGWQLAAHVQGDRTFDVVLDAYEAAITRHRLVDHRFRIEHCALPQPRHIEKAVRLGVTFSFFLSHLWYWGEALRDGMFGEERASRYMPIGSALRAGMRGITVHCDAPMTDPDAVRCLNLAVNRRTRQGSVIGADETIPLVEAIRALTIHAAWQLRSEASLGSIEVGKFADFTVFDRNPLGLDLAEIGSLRVLGTWIGGQPVWSA